MRVNTTGGLFTAILGRALARGLMVDVAHVNESQGVQQRLLNRTDPKSERTQRPQGIANGVLWCREMLFQHCGWFSATFLGMAAWTWV